MKQCKEMVWVWVLADR